MAFCLQVPRDGGRPCRGSENGMEFNARQVVVKEGTGPGCHQFKRGSILMRWMKLEPIIQSEVSQKDKDHYSILTHIYGI